MPPDPQAASASALSVARVTSDVEGNVTIKMPLYAAGRPVFIFVLTLLWGAICAYWVWHFYPWSRFGVWPSVPIVLEFAYIWLLACFAYKTSVIRRDGVYEQSVTFLPRLVGPKSGVTAVCFGRIVAIGRYGKIVQYPVRIRLSKNEAYDLVYDAGTPQAAQTLARQLGEATHLPVEPAIPRTTSIGMARLAAIVVAMALFPVLYNVFVYTVVPSRPEPPPAPDIRASADARTLTVDLDDLAPPYEIAPLAKPWALLPFTVKQLAARA